MVSERVDHFRQTFRFLEYIVNCTDWEDPVNNIHLDFNKAIDKVSQRGLLQKSNHCDIGGIVNGWGLQGNVHY